MAEYYVNQPPPEQKSVIGSALGHAVVWGAGIAALAAGGAAAYNAGWLNYPISLLKGLEKPATEVYHSLSKEITEGRLKGMIETVEKSKIGEWSKEAWNFFTVKGSDAMLAVKKNLDIPSLTAKLSPLTPETTANVTKLAEAFPPVSVKKAALLSAGAGAAIGAIGGAVSANGTNTKWQNYELQREAARRSALQGLT